MAIQICIVATAMRALVYAGPQQLEWRDAPEPRIAGDGEAIVRHVAVATCDLDAMIVGGVSPFPAPFAIGHEGVADVLEVGDGVTTVRPGDRVLVPFQISCGTCGACRAGRTGNCETLPLGQTYGFGFGPDQTKWGGFLSDAVHVPFADAMLVKLPDGLAPEQAASASDNITDAYRAIAPHLRARPGAPVLICGGGGSGSIGLYAVAQARALGAEDVLYVDPDPGRRAVAEGYGARTLDHVPERLDDRFPITVDAAGAREALALALGSLDRDGVCTSTAIYFDPATIPPFPLLPLYVMGSTFVTGRIHARHDAPAVLDLLADGTLDVAPVTTKVVPFDDAAEALLEDYTKLVFTR
jgi:threonine dehydrogenase-like Zn-dependent dehydrogenase